nr:hypothetical protein [Rathayibacter sp. AY1A7]
MHEDPLEEDLVEKTPDVIGSAFVLGGALHGDVEGELDGVLDVRDVLSEACFGALGDRPLCADAVLLVLEEVEGDRVCVVRLEEAKLFAFEPLQIGPDLRALPLGIAASGHELVMKQPLKVVSGDAVEPETLLVLLDDLLLYDVDEDRFLRAVVPFRLTRGAVEVGVDLARLRPRHLHDQAVVTVPAVHRALEVVVVSTSALAGAARLQCVLHLVPRLLVDQGLVLAGVGRSGERDEAEIVGVGQNLVEIGIGEGPGGNLRGPPRGEPALSELKRELGQADVGLGVAVEGPGDERSAVSVWANRAAFAAVAVELANVEVPERCPSGCPALLNLLRHSLGDLVSEVARVELCNRRHDAVKKRAGWGLVDALRGGDQGHICGGQLLHDLDVVLAVAGEAIDLVDDDVVDRVLTDVLEHLLKRRTVCCLRGLSAVDELLGDHGAHRLSLLPVRLPLRRDREPLLLITALRLTSGRHAEVEDRDLRRQHLADHGEGVGGGRLRAQGRGGEKR